MRKFFIQRFLETPERPVGFAMSAEEWTGEDFEHMLDLILAMKFCSHLLEEVKTKILDGNAVLIGKDLFFIVDEK